MADQTTSVPSLPTVMPVAFAQDSGIMWIVSPSSFDDAGLPVGLAVMLVVALARATAVPSEDFVSVA